MQKQGELPQLFIEHARCNAKTRLGKSCTRFPLKNGKCPSHGGLSTGARTPEGLSKVRKVNIKHGEYSAEARFLKQFGAKTMGEFKEGLRKALEYSEKRLRELEES